MRKWRRWLRKFWIVSSPDRFTDASLLLPVRPSFSLAWLVFIVHAAGLGALWSNDLFTLSLKLALTLALALSAAQAIARTLQWQASPLVQVHYVSREVSGARADADVATWRLLFASGQVQTARLMDPVYVSDYFLILRFCGLEDSGQARVGRFLKDRQCQQTVVIAAESMPADQYRRAKVLLRHRAARLISLAK